MIDNWRFTDLDEQVAQEFQDFLPERVFDAHAHVYRVADLNLEGSSLFLEGPPEVMVIFTIDRFYSREIPCKAVSDLEIEDSPPFSSISMRRCGVQFGELTQEQESQLDYFLQNHTVGHA